MPTIYDKDDLAMAEVILSEIRAAALKLKPPIDPPPLADTVDLGVLGSVVRIAIQAHLLPLAEKGNPRANRHFVYSAVCGTDIVDGNQLYWHTCKAMRKRWQGESFKPNDRCKIEAPILLRYWFQNHKGQQVLPLEGSNEPIISPTVQTEDTGGHEDPHDPGRPA